MYGDLSMEDVDEFEGLEPNNAREIVPGGRFQRDEVRSFDRDFEEEMEDEDIEDRDEEAYWEPRWYPDEFDDNILEDDEEDPIGDYDS
jgi:hypothetical protein